MKGRPQNYVQYMFPDSRGKFYCEASLFYYAERETKPRMSYMPPDAMAALE